MRVKGTIVGSGIIGSAIAFELSRRGIADLHVIDPDREGALSSTERNAGGVRHLWQQPINVELSRRSIQLFESVKSEIGFQQTGYLWLMSNERKDSGEAFLRAAKERGLSYEQWNVSDIRRRYPFLDKLGDVAFGIFGAKDGLINSNAVKMYYQNEASKRGVKFHNRTALLKLKENATSVSLSLGQFDGEANAEKYLREESTPNEELSWESDFVILAGGPWMHRILTNLGVPSELEPIRRQIALFKSETFDMTPYGMVVDTSRVYFHPEGGNILSGLVLKNEPTGYRFHLDPDFFETHIWPALFERSSQMERLKPLGGWGGLYSYTPDTSGILNRLPGHKKVLEAHSFTGRGVMQSYGVAIAVADLLLHNKFVEIDASSLDRSRFQKPKSEWLSEELHI